MGDITVVDYVDDYYKARQDVGLWDKACVDEHMVKLIRRCLKSPKGAAVMSATRIKKLSNDKFKFRKSYREIVTTLEDILASTMLSLYEFARHEGCIIQIRNVEKRKLGYWTWVREFVAAVTARKFQEASDLLISYSKYRSVNLEAWIEVRCIYELDLLGKI